MKQLIFYTKLNCHLCDRAYQVLMDIVLDLPLTIEVVDITHAHNAGLLDKYGHRIPVIARPEAKTDLSWPFTAAEVREYLAS